MVFSSKRVHGRFVRRSCIVRTTNVFGINNPGFFRSFISAFTSPEIINCSHIYFFISIARCCSCNLHSAANQSRGDKANAHLKSNYKTKQDFFKESTDISFGVWETGHQWPRRRKSRIRKGPRRRSLPAAFDFGAMPNLRPATMNSSKTAQCIIPSRNGAGPAVHCAGKTDI